MVNGLLVALWLLGRLLAPPDRGTDSGGPGEVEVGGTRWRLLRYGPPALVLLSVVGGIILSPTYLAFLIDGKGYSVRNGALDREFAIACNALHPSGVATLASPYAPLMKLYAPGRDFYSGTDVSSIGLYTGATVVWLALGALLIRPGSAWQWWLAVVAALYLGVAMGSALPLRGWLYDYVPPTRFFKQASLFRGPALFLVAVLALYGSRDLAGLIRLEGWSGIGPGRAGRGWARWAAALAGLVVLICALVAYQRTVGRWAEPTWPDRDLADAHLALCWGGVAAIAVMLALRSRGVPRSAALGALIALAMADSLLTAYLSRGTTYSLDVGMNNAWDSFEARHVTDLDLTPRGLDRIPFNALLAPRVADTKGLITKTAAFKTYTPFYNHFHLIWSENPALVEMVTGPDRIWFAPTASVVDAHLSDATFGAFCRRTEGVRGDASGHPPL